MNFMKLKPLTIFSLFMLCVSCTATRNYWIDQFDGPRAQKILLKGLIKNDHWNMYTDSTGLQYLQSKSAIEYCSFIPIPVKVYDPSVVECESFDDLENYIVDSGTEYFGLLYYQDRYIGVQTTTLYRDDRYVSYVSGDLPRDLLVAIKNNASSYFKLNGAIMHRSDSALYVWHDGIFLEYRNFLENNFDELSEFTRSAYYQGIPITEEERRQHQIEFENYRDSVNKARN